MKKKKGFTLIELLAVIVVLAIILVLAVPKILDLIEKADRQAYKESAELMAHTAQIQYQTKEVTGSAPVIPDEGIIYTFEEGVQTVSGNYDLLKFKGDKPYSGTITLTKDKKVIIEKLVSKNKKWCAIKEANEKQARVGRRTDPEFNCKIDGEDEVVIEDKKACELEIDEETGVYYVDSPSDLYALSQNVKSGNKYSGKTIKVRNNLDMSDVSNTCGQDSFFPIGTSSNPFGGTFDGGAKTISNLEVIANENFSNQVGLFGTIGGTSDSYANIYGVILQSPEIIGKQQVGTLAGKVNSYVNIYEIQLIDINVTGSDYVGGLIGFYEWFPENINNILVKSGYVESSAFGGLINGQNNYRYSNSIVENTTLKAPTIYLTSADYNSYHSNNVIVNENQVASGFNANAINDINFYEAIGLDTWIGGDNDSSGYYFDYDGNEVVLKSTVKNPFPNESKILANGSGTKDDPYLIKNESDWKKITVYPNKTDFYVKLDSNLDFSNNKFYMLGSEQGVFTGTFIGNDKIIKNVEVNGLGNSKGIFGYAHGATIYGFSLDNISISGSKYIGIIGMLGGNSDKYGNAYAIRINNLNLSGTTYVGGMYGYSNYYVYLNEIELSGEKTNITGTTYVGSLMGYDGSHQEFTNNLLVKNAVVTATNGRAGLVSGTPGDAFSNTIVENVILTATDSTHGGTYAGYNSYYSGNIIVNGNIKPNGFDVSNIDNIYYYKGILETLFKGDANNTGYFFDLTDDGKIHLVKAYTLTPPTTEDTGESIGPSTGVCSKYSCTCECGCTCTNSAEAETRCKVDCNLD